MTNHETAKHLRDAQRRLRSVLVANADRLSTPFTDDPSKNPWDTYLRPAVRGLQEAVSAACDALAAAAAVSVPPPATRADDRAAVDLADGQVRCPLCVHTVTLHTPNGARAHFAAVHPEQRITGRGHGPWPLLVTDGAEAQSAVSGPCAAGEQQNETPEARVCGRTKSVAGTEYPPCGREPGHEEAYCRSADGKQHFLAVGYEEPHP